MRWPPVRWRSGISSGDWQANEEIMSLQYQLIEQTESAGDPTQQLMRVMAFLSLSVLCLAFLSTVGYVPGDLAAAGCGEYGARCSRALYIVTTEVRKHSLRPRNLLGLQS